MTNNDNTLVLFINEYKEKDTQPDYKGKGTIGGKEFKAAGWKKIGGKTNTVYLSVKLTPEEDEEQVIPRNLKAHPTSTAKSSFDEEIPF